MILTKEENEILAGKRGTGRQKAMELLLAVGESLNADKMIPVSSSHLVIPEIQLFFKNKKAQWGMEITRSMLTDVDRFAVPTTTNALILDIEKGHRLKIPDPFLEEMKEIFTATMNYYEKRGAIPNYSCAPYFDFFYKKGEHLGGAESIQVLFNNSINGSRVNRETGPTALATAITGVTPNFGMHLEENRAGEILFELDSSLKPETFTDADLNAIGYYVGRMSQEKIPVLAGFPTVMSGTQLKYLCVPLAVSAGIPMVHIAGVTPEAPTVEHALHFKKPIKTYTIGIREIESSYNLLNTAESVSIDYIAVGCPHCSLNELRMIRDLLINRKVNGNVIFFIAVSAIKYELAEKMGIIDEIESSGAVVVKSMCPGASIFGRYGNELGVKAVATNSAKNAHYIGAHSGGNVKTHFGSIYQCVDAACSGRWR